ncbi:MAG TPA: glycosyltransferase family 2 protein [Anaerolineales bacterium]|nr:glycosyltransferase family 2 protein [Anaerolineales bacterium]
MKLSVVVPCFNEEDNIDKLKSEFFPVLEGLLGGNVDGGQIDSIEVVFVDDGSSDGTYAALKNAFGSFNHPSILIKFEKHEVNRGLGAAVRTGFGSVTGDIIVTTDSDGTYHFSTIPTLLEYLKGKVSIVTASPYHPKGEVVGVPGYRIFLSKGSSLIYRILLSWKVHTYTALYRAYRREVVDNITFAANDFLGGTELLVKAMLKGYQVDEFPAALHQRMFGVSKAKLVKTIKSHLNFQFRLILHRLHLRSMFAG